MSKLGVLKTKALKALYGSKGYDAYRYRQITGRKLDLDNPQTWSEKLLWLNYNWLPQIKSDCADKYKVRDYVTQKGYGDTLVKLLGRWDDANDIDFDALPNRFVLKCNHGCAMNILVEDKTKLNRKVAIKQLNKWMNTDYTKRVAELHYGQIIPCIICEEFLPVNHNSEIVDFKIHCFNGEPKWIGICYERDRVTLHAKELIMSPDWQRLMYLKSDKPDDGKTIPCPEKLDKMLNMAKDLSTNFPYVRVDLYYIKGNIYFGELTFTPSGNIPAGGYIPEIDEIAGKYLNLDNVKKIIRK